jgi:hypothetical protein
MPWSRLSFRAVAAVVAAVSFLVLLTRGRPIGTERGVEPLLFTAGLTQPRGLAFGPDGDLFVAEAGLAPAGGQAAPGRIVLARGDGQFEVVAGGLPAAGDGDALFAQPGPSALVRDGAAAMYAFLGPSDEARLGTTYQIVGGGGEWELRPLGPVDAGLEATAAPSAAWGAAGTAEADVYATLPAANQLIRLRPGAGAAGGLVTSAITGFVDAGQSNPHPVGSAPLAGGLVAVALFGSEPYRAGGGRVAIVQPDGRWQVAYESLRFPVAIGRGPGNQLFVLEFAAGYDPRSSRFTPRSGRLLAVGPAPGRRRVVVREINYPTALTFAPNGDAFLTENGAFSGVGEGRILRVPGQTLRGLG